MGDNNQSPGEPLPTVLPESTLDLMGFTIRVYHLSDGRRVMDAGDVEKFFGPEGRDMLAGARPVAFPRENKDD